MLLTGWAAVVVTVVVEEGDHQYLSAPAPTHLPRVVDRHTLVVVAVGGEVADWLLGLDLLL